MDCIEALSMYPAPDGVNSLFISPFIVVSYNPPMSTISSSLAHLRKAKDITQEQLAEQVGVTRQTIIAIEKGNYTPSLLLAFKIASVFKLSIESIFHYEKS